MSTGQWNNKAASQTAFETRDCHAIRPNRGRFPAAWANGCASTRRDLHRGAATTVASPRACCCLISPATRRKTPDIHGCIRSVRGHGIRHIGRNPCRRWWRWASAFRASSQTISVKTGTPDGWLRIRTAKRVRARQGGVFALDRREPTAKGRLP